jgi:hypothetical protein
MSRDTEERLSIIRRVFPRQVNSRYSQKPIDLAHVQRAKRSYDQIMSHLLAMHDSGECLILACGCPCCGTFNPDSDITELEPDDLTP